MFTTQLTLSYWTKWRWGRFSPSTSVSPANHHSTNFYTITITYHPGLVQQGSSGRSTQSSTAHIKKKPLTLLYSVLSLTHNLKVSGRGENAIYSVTPSNVYIWAPNLSRALARVSVCTLHCACAVRIDLLDSEGEIVLQLSKHQGKKYTVTCSLIASQRPWKKQLRNIRC
jgi:hypothetical protein